MKLNKELKHYILILLYGLMTGAWIADLINFLNGRINKNSIVISFLGMIVLSISWTLNEMKNNK